MRVAAVQNQTTQAFHFIASHRTTQCLSIHGKVESSRSLRRLYFKKLARRLGCSAIGSFVLSTLCRLEIGTTSEMATGLRLLRGGRGIRRPGWARGGLR